MVLGHAVSDGRLPRNPAAGESAGCHEGREALLRAERWPPLPGRVGLVRFEPLRMRGHQHPGVQDLHQPVGHDDLDRLTGEGRADDIVEPGEGDPAGTVHPRSRPPAGSS